MNTAPLIKR